MARVKRYEHKWAHGQIDLNHFLYFLQINTTWLKCGRRQKWKPIEKKVFNLEAISTIKWTPKVPVQTGREWHCSEDHCRTADSITWCVVFGKEKGLFFLFWHFVCFFVTHSLCHPTNDDQVIIPTSPRCIFFQALFWHAHIWAWLEYVNLTWRGHTH